MECHPCDFGNQDIYLIYACGNDFVLSGATLRLEVARYDQNESKAIVENRFRVIYNKPFSLVGDAIQGY